MDIPRDVTGLLRGYAREAYLRIALRSALRGIEHRNPILIYQMGKVGSSTVVRTLEHLDLRVPILHVHTLSRDHIRVATDRQRRSGSPHLPKHLITSQVLDRTVGADMAPCRIITLTREPIGRAISFTFEDRVKQAPDAIGPDGAVDPVRIAAAVRRLLSAQSGVADPTHWFDRELKACFGIDVFAQRHDVERGYTIIERQNVSVLVLRMEDLNRALPAALAAFLGLARGTIRVFQANEGVRKRYARAFADVKGALRLPPDRLSRITGTKYFQHFYAADLERVVSRWSSVAPDARRGMGRTEGAPR